VPGNDERVTKRFRDNCRVAAPREDELKKMRIAIVGAGAIGGWLGARLAASGQAVSVFARGKTLEAVGRHGLRLTARGESKSYHVPASASADELGPQDLVIVAVKGPALAAVAPHVAQMLGPDTSVLPAMNGVPWWFTTGLGGPLADKPLQSVDPAGMIARHIPPERAIGCVVHASCAVPEPGHVAHNNGNRLIVGEPQGGNSPRLQRIADALRAASFDVAVSDRIQQDVWYKLWGNMTINPISALTGATADRILDDDLLRTFTFAVMAEASEIGRRVGCPIVESGEDRIAVTRRLGAFKTSMLQDAEAGRPMEVDALLAAPREIAGTVGIKTPYMDALHGLARLLAGSRAMAME
jgi:2-dehydropantoate 2-reductase